MILVTFLLHEDIFIVSFFIYISTVQYVNTETVKRNDKAHSTRVWVSGGSYCQSLLLDIYSLSTHQHALL